MPTKRKVSARAHNRDAILKVLNSGFSESSEFTPSQLHRIADYLARDGVQGPEPLLRKGMRFTLLLGSERQEVMTVDELTPRGQYVNHITGEHVEMVMMRLERRFKGQKETD